MATYLVTVNNVLRELNEPVITTVGTTSGIQTAVKGFVDKAIRDINNSELEYGIERKYFFLPTEASKLIFVMPLFIGFTLINFPFHSGINFISLSIDNFMVT